MYRVTQTGSIADAIAQARDIPARVIPYAASTAINRTLSDARKDVRAEMPRVFDRPNAWTLNSLRVRPAKKEKLVGSLDVKDDAPNNGTRPEDYLLPSVEGGGRKEKRFERNLRYAGILSQGQRAMIGRDAKVDQYGNMSRGEIQRILTAVRASFDPAQNRTGSAKSKKNAKKAPYLVAGLKWGGWTTKLKTPGIYIRDGREIKPVLVFTKKLPQYRKRLDFYGIADMRVKRDFLRQFNAAAQSILTRRR